MTVERTLQICLAAVAGLGALLLGLGQQNITLPVVAMFAAATSVFFTDRRKWFRLNHHFANLAALGAVGYTILGFLEHDASTRLLAIANLLIYLQIILLYQEKNERVYWQILVLSLLQVVVAAALNLGVEFGFLLILYMFLALTTLALLFVYCESLPFLRDLPSPSTVRHHQTAPRRAAAGRRFVPVALSESPAESMCNRGLVGQIMKLALTTLVLTFMVFFLTPRFGNSAWKGAVSNNESTVGFSQEVTLNDLGEILENPEIVMRVQFETSESKTAYQVNGEVYYRGAVLSDYLPVVGKWRADPSELSRNGVELPAAPSQRDLVRQVVVPEPSTSLFGVTPSFKVDDTPSHVRIHPHTSQLVWYRDDDEPVRVKQLRYVVGTNAFRRGWHRSIVPVADFASASETIRLQYLHNEHVRDCLSFNPQGMPVLARTARDILRNQNLPDSDRIGQARALEQYFHRGGRFRYSLILADSAPDDVDPIEHFVAESHEGHCEYFASALVMMLRSVDIPARLVVGFRGGDYNSVGGYYQVRQLHAHAWVEAYLEPGQIPHAELAAGESGERGAWLRLDATPADLNEGTDLPGISLFTRLNQCKDYFQLLWNEYILGLDVERQRAAIYRPISERFVSAFTDYLFNPQWWRTFRVELTQKLGLDSPDSFRQRWFNWRAAPVVLGVVLLIIASVLLLRRMFRGPWLLLRDFGVSRVEHWRNARAQRVDFYRRLERLMKRHGLRRQPTQTPLEFAQQAGELLRRRAGCQALADVPLLVSQQYYQVRFGRRALDPSQWASLELCLSQLEAALATDRKRGLLSLVGRGKTT